MKDSDKPLFRDYLDERISSENLDQLNDLLETDAEARVEFRAMATIEEGLRDLAVPLSDFASGANHPMAELDAPPSASHSWLLWLPIAAVFILSFIVISQFRKGSKSGAEQQFVARFGQLQDSRWINSSTQIEQGDAIAVGQRIELSSGHAEVFFHTGARLELVGPTILEVSSDNSGFLSMGEVSIVAETPESKGFTMKTPTSSFIDIGTAFTATVSPDGLSRLEVTEGTVDVVLDETDDPRRFKAGETLYVEPGETKILARIESGDETRAFRFPNLPPPSRDDYADQTKGFASITVAKGTLRNLDKTRGSGSPEVLLDGVGQTGKDRPRQSSFFDGSENGSFLIDLGKPVSIHTVNTYSWHQNRRIEEHRERAQQEYTLYGYAGDPAPETTGDPESAGWIRIIRVNSDKFFRVNERIDRPAQQGCSVTSSDGVIGNYRYLLWELDNNTLFGEIDVFAEPEIAN